MNAPLPELLRLLTPREREVLLFRLRGLTPAEIAAKCGISYHTGRTHMRNISRKLGMNGHDCTQWLALAAAYWRAEGFEAGRQAGYAEAWDYAAGLKAATAYEAGVKAAGHGS